MRVVCSRELGCLLASACTGWLLLHAFGDAVCEDDAGAIGRLHKFFYLLYRHRCTWVREDGRPRHRMVVESEDDVKQFLSRGMADPMDSAVVPAIDASTLHGEGGLRSLLQAIEHSATSSVIVRRAFRPQLLERSAPMLRAQYDGTNGFFPAPPACNVSNERRRRRVGPLHLSDVFASGHGGKPALTDLHISLVIPALSHRPEPASRGCHGRFGPGSVEDALLSQVLTSGSGSVIQAPVLQWLARGHRQIFSAGRAGAHVQFHVHGATWLALTHGRKAWWLGPRRLAIQLWSFGTDAPTCDYLTRPRNRPDARVAFVVQEVRAMDELRTHASPDQPWPRLSHR